MAGEPETGKPKPQERIEPLPPTHGGANFPPPQMPAIYADVIWNVARGPGVVKMYLARNDLDLGGSPAGKINVFAQLVLPTLSFATATIFFNRQLQLMLQSGEVSQAQIDELEALFTAQEAASAKPNE
jgi:hypothetical protein